MEENARLKAKIEAQEIASTGAKTPSLKDPVVKNREILRAKKARDLSRKARVILAPGLEEPPSQSSYAETNSAHGDRVSQLGEDSLEDNIGSPEILDEKAGYKSNFERRKRGRPPKRPPTNGFVAQGKRRSMRQVSHYNGKTGEFDVEEDSDFLFQGGPDYIGSRTHLDKLNIDGMDMHGHRSPNTRPQHAEPNHFGSSNLAGLGIPRGGIYDAGLPNQTGHPSTELGLEHATRSQSGGTITSHERPDLKPFGGRRSTLPSLNSASPHSDVELAGHTEQEAEPGRGVQHPPESTMTSQESELLKNMEQM